MHPQLTYVIAQERIADLRRRLNAPDRPLRNRSCSPTGGA